MEETLRELLEKLENAEGYMIGISVVEGNKIDNTFITNKFNKLNMLPAHKEIKDLIINELEKADDEAEFKDIV